MAKENKKAAKPTILLRNPEISYDGDGKIVTITGQCTNKISGKYCTNKRTIKHQDAHQVYQCQECQKKLQWRKIADKRKARRAEARKARETAKAQVTMDAATGV